MTARKRPAALPIEGDELMPQDRPLESMWMFFKTFRAIIGIGTNDGILEPHRMNANKEKAVIWRTLNGWRWKFTIERERV
jgi:hypothetical protein